MGFGKTRPMKSGERLSQSEVRNIQLEILDEIDAFCRAEGIRYSIAFGTLLGAIRHKGFIPWDDDLDIIMPLPDMQTFKKSFTSPTLQYLDIDTYKHFDHHFSRISHNATYGKYGPFNKSYGVNIDLYPVVGMPDTEEEMQEFFPVVERLYNKRTKMLLWKYRFIRRFPVKDIPGYDPLIRRLRDTLFNGYPFDGAKRFLHAGGVKRVNVFDFDVFEHPTDVDFEGHRYRGIQRYDDYLTHCYGDYMQLPPEEERIPYHGGKYYWK